MARNLLALASLLLVGLLLACVIMSAALRTGMITPVIGRVTLGGYMLDTTIENRVCLQRVLQQPCRPPVYLLRLSVDAATGTHYYHLASLPISARYAFYP